MVDGIVGDKGAAGEVEALGEGAELLLGRDGQELGIVQGRAGWPEVEDAVGGGFELLFDARIRKVDGPARASDPADQRDGGGGRWACGREKSSECGLELRTHRIISSQVLVSAVSASYSP